LPSHEHIEIIQRHLAKTVLIGCHAVVDANGLPLHVAITGGQQHDSLAAHALLDGLPSGEWFSPTRLTTQFR
jgi:hypothetical protein